MTLDSIGDRVAEGTYQFHSRFRRAVNFTDGNRLVAVVDPSVGDGPLNIVLRNFSPGTSRDPLQVLAGRVVFERQEYPVTSRYCSILPGNGWRAGHCSAIRGLARSNAPRSSARNDKTGLSLFRELLILEAPPKSLAFLLDAQREQNFQTGFEQRFVEHVHRCVHQIFHGDQLDGVRALHGCGLGLTPSGDDFLAGHLIGLNLRGQPTNAVFEAARSANLFSNTFLELAAQGRLFGRMKNLVLALMHGGEASVRECTRKLFAIGETSGADLGTGFYMTMTLGAVRHRAHGAHTQVRPYDQSFTGLRRHVGADLRVCPEFSAFGPNG